MPPCRELRVSGRAPTEGRERIDVRHVQAPGEEPDQRGASRRCDRGRVVRPDQRDADRALVEPLRVRPDDVPVDTAPPAFEDLAVLVDEEVVADVVPAVREHVVALDPAHDRGRLRAAVRVRAGRVVDDREAQRVGVGGLLAPTNLLVRAPARPGDDQRRARLRDRPQPDLADRAPDVVRADAADRGRTCAPGSGWRARSSRDCRAATRSRAARACARPARRPRGAASRQPLQRPRDGSRPNETAPAALPVQPDQVEPVHRAIDAGTHVVRGERRPGGERGARRRRPAAEGLGEEPSSGGPTTEAESRAGDKAADRILTSEKAALAVLFRRDRRGSRCLRHRLSYDVAAACPRSQVRERRQSGHAGLHQRPDRTREPRPLRRRS